MQKKQNFKTEETKRNNGKRSKSKSPENNRIIYTPEIIEGLNDIKNQSVNMNINTFKPEPKKLFGENKIYKKPLLSLKESKIVHKKDNNKNYYHKNTDFFENDYSDNRILGNFISPIKITNNNTDVRILTMPIWNYTPTKKKEKIKEGEGLLKLIEFDDIVKKRKKIKKTKKDERKMTPDLKHVNSKKNLEEHLNTDFTQESKQNKKNAIKKNKIQDRYIDYWEDNDRDEDIYDIVNTVPQNINMQNECIRRYSENYNS